MSLGDLEGHDAIAASVGKRIETVRMDGSGLSLVLEDGRTLSIADMGQDCCEHRYMTCGDEPDLSTWTGARLEGVEVLDAPSVDGCVDTHEVQFLHVKTDLGTIVCETHNEHNGFYGGFSVRARLS